ncbi:MAG: universal stress protein [Candidatus Sulfobium sp.]|jgi:nucleotide-binding universal stress UspA family protein
MKILLATDGSEYSERAARFLARLRLSSEDEIAVLHVVSWVPFNYDAEAYHESLKHIRMEIAPKILDSTIELLGPVKARISTEIIDGAPERYIIEAARNYGAGMIVMGAKGIKGIKSLIVGSVTKAVALSSPIPVLVIKQPVGGDAALRILFATDGSDYSIEAARFLARIPFPEDTELTVMNAIWSDFSDIPERFVMEVDDRIKGAVAEKRSGEIAESESILKDAQILLEDRFGKVKKLSKIGDPSLEILNTAESLKSDIIAVGCRGMKGIKGVMGSVSRNVLNHAACSVFIGKTCRE